MKIKIYNENGVVKITKISASGLEQALFSNLKDGEFAEINVEVANLSLVANKYSITE
jgi:hypothetical protein